MEYLQYYASVDPLKQEMFLVLNLVISGIPSIQNDLVKETVNRMKF